MKPYTILLSSTIKCDKNTIETEVTNQWTNRLISNMYFPDGRTGYHAISKQVPDWFSNKKPNLLKQCNSFTTFNVYTKDSEFTTNKLRESFRLTSVCLINLLNN